MVAFMRSVLDCLLLAVDAGLLLVITTAWFASEAGLERQAGRLRESSSILLRWHYYGGWGFPCDLPLMPSPRCRARAAR
jgi:hypothetical protein